MITNSLNLTLTVTPYHSCLKFSDYIPKLNTDLRFKAKER